MLAQEQQNTNNPESSYIPRMAKIAEIKDFTELEKFYRLEFDDGKPLGHEPGQFIMVSILGIGEAPISICSEPREDHSFDLCVRKVGSLTEALHGMKVGDTLGIRGPFGHGFEPEKMKGHDILFVGGGIGMVPMRSIVQYVLDPAHRDDFGKVSILYGVKTPKEFLFPEEIAKWRERDDVDYHCTCDNADSQWKGNIGVITTLIPPLEIDPEKTIAVVVGPPVMYKFVILSLQGKKMKNKNIYVSLERRMKCGLGKCGHCQINNSYVCQDGPVYNYDKIKNLKEAFS